MNTITRLSLFAILSIPVACGSNGDGRGDGESGGTDTAEDTSGGMTTTMTATTATSTATTLTTTTDPTDTETDTDPTDTATTGDEPFNFEDGDPEDYTQIDRMGMPAIATAVITNKDDYNAASPVDDANADFVPEIVANVTGLHDALDDDLANAKLTPCAVDVCIAQAAPLVVPDVIRVNFTNPSGFPNGRQPTDPVIDVTLAVVLLDLSVHDAGTLAGLPLNPPEGDVALPAGFPYFAEPH